MFKKFFNWIKECIHSMKSKEYDAYWDWYYNPENSEIRNIPCMYSIIKGFQNIKAFMRNHIFTVPSKLSIMSRGIHATISLSGVAVWNWLLNNNYISTFIYKILTSISIIHSGCFLFAN